MPHKHTFSYTPDTENPYDQTSVEVQSSAVELSKVVEAMEAYLLACGFMFPINCHLDLVEDDVPRAPDGDANPDDLLTVAERRELASQILERNGV